MTNIVSKIADAVEFETLLYGNSNSGGTLISNELFDTTRWTELWEAIWFETHADGKHYFKVLYNRPSSENEMDESEAFDVTDIVEVFPQEVTVTKYYTQKELNKQK